MSKEIAIIKELNEFKGKRNCVLTIFIPPERDFMRDIKKIEKSIYNIKNDFKRDQLLPIIKKIKGKLGSIDKIKDEGLIVCCGLALHHNDIHYQDLPSLKRIKNFEYYYDYNFHINKIITCMFNNVVYMDPKFNKEISHKLKHLVHKNRLVYPNKAQKWFDQNLVSTVYWLSTEAVDFEMLQMAIDKKIQIIIHNGKLDEIISKELAYVAVLKVTRDLLQFI